MSSSDPTAEMAYCNKDQIECLWEEIHTMKGMIANLGDAMEATLSGRLSSMCNNTTSKATAEVEDGSAVEEDQLAQPWDGSGTHEWEPDYDTEVDPWMFNQEENTSYFFGISGSVFCIISETDDNGSTNTKYLVPLEETKGYCLKLDGVLQGQKFHDFSKLEEKKEGDVVLVYVAGDTSEKVNPIYLKVGDNIYCGMSSALDFSLLKDARVYLPTAKMNSKFAAFKTHQHLHFMSIQNQAELISRHYDTDFTASLRANNRTGGLRAVLVLVLMQYMNKYQDMKAVPYEKRNPGLTFTTGGSCGLCTVKNACSFVTQNLHWGLEAHCVMYKTGIQASGAPSASLAALSKQYGDSTGMKLNM